MGPFIEQDVSARTDARVNFPRRIRPLGALIHTTAGSNSLLWLQGDSAEAGKPASADYLISRDGHRYKISPAGRCAYHAGSSRLFHSNILYKNDKVSEVLIGIELEQAGEQDITREQYVSLAELLQELALTWAWAGDYPIYGHYAVARPLGRRSDPCNFDWGVLRALLRDASVQLPLPHL